MTNKPLDGIMLKMYEMNIDHQSPRALLNKCMNPPEFNHVNLTLKKLEKVKALDIPSDTITKLGNGLNNFGLDPQLAKIIIYRVVLQKCHENGQNKVFMGLNPLPKLGYFKNQIFFIKIYNEFAQWVQRVRSTILTPLNGTNWTISRDASSHATFPEVLEPDSLIP